MVFIEKNLVTLGGQLKRGDVFQTFGYLTSTDSKATVLTAGFFDDVKESLTRNDIIKVVDKTVSPSETYEVIVTVLPLSGNVEVAELTPAGDINYKGVINLPADFPTAVEVETGDLYRIGTDVTDNDPTKTNTGQSFDAGDEIFWNGTDWTELGANEIWKRTGTVIEPFTAGDILKVKAPGSQFGDPANCLFELTEFDTGAGGYLPHLKGYSTGAGGNNYIALDSVVVLIGGDGTTLPDAKIAFYDNDNAAANALVYDGVNDRLVSAADLPIYLHDGYLQVDSLGIEFQAAATAWVFRYKAGIGIDDTGLQFNLASTAVELMYANNDFLQSAINGNLTLTDLTGGANDITVSFVSGTTGIFKWMEDEDYFLFADNIVLNTGFSISFKDTQEERIEAPNTDQLDFYVNNQKMMKLAAGGLTIGANVAGDLYLHFDANSNNGTITWMEDEDLFSFSDKVLLDFSVTGAATHNYHEVQTGITGIVATNVTAYRATLQDDSSSDTGHIKIGFDVDNTMKHNQEGGDWKDYGAYLDMGSLAEIPNGSAFPVNYELYGAYIKRSSICVGNALSGSWNDISACGIYLEGWSGAVPGDDDAGIAGTFERYAIYSDGGDIKFDDCSLAVVGDITLTGLYNFYIRDPQIKVSSDTDGHLDLTADISIDLNTLNVQIGDGTNDASITFNAANDGILKWWTDEDYFQFDDDVMIPNGEKLYLYDVNKYLMGTVGGVYLFSDGIISLFSSNGSDTYIMSEGLMDIEGYSSIWMYGSPSMTIDTDTDFTVNSPDNIVLNSTAIDLNSLAIQFGTNVGDITLTFDSNPNNGILKWWTDEDYFEFQDSILMNGSEPLYFFNIGSYVYYDGTNLTLVDDAQININAAIVDINAATGLALDGANLNSNWLVNATNEIQFRDNAIYIYSNADGWLNLVADVGVEINADIWNLGDLYAAGNVLIGGELQGCRQQFTAGSQVAKSASVYLIAGIGGVLAMSATSGFRAIRAGSIVGLSFNGNVTIETTQGNIQLQARVNDTNVYEITVASAGVAWINGVGSQARGTDTFAAGDLITLYVNWDSFVGSIDDIIGVVEVVYDS